MNKLLPGILLLFLFSCSGKKSEESKSAGTIATDPNTSTSSPFLTRDHKGNIVLSWIKEINDSTAVMCFAVSTDNGSSFGETVEIMPSKGVHPHSENLPKMIYKPDGEIIAAWGIGNPNPKNKYSGLIYYAQSFDGGKSWSKAVPLVTDTASYDQRYFDLAVLKNGEAGIIWLDNRTDTDKEGMTVYYAETKGKNGFINEKPINNTTCQCCRTDLFVDSKGFIHAAFRDILNDTIRDMAHIVSVDGGKTFSAPKRISPDNWVIDGCPHTGPTMTENQAGLHFSWFTAGGQSGVYYCNSKDNGAAFSPRQMLHAEARHPQLTTLENGTLGMVWDETVRKGPAIHTKIVLHQPALTGQKANQDVTSDSISASYPVLIGNGKKGILVAWVQASEEKAGTAAKNKFPNGKQVFYKTVQMN